MKVLHITTWFPNRRNTREALWIKRHIDALHPYCENEVWHIRTIENTKLNYQSYTLNGCKHRLISLPTSSWFVIEIVTFFQLLIFVFLQRSSIRNSDVINFHIAYPSLTFWKILRIFITKPVVVTEHWSAYHFNFGVKQKLLKIQRIFSFNLPLIVVSKALLKDVIVFSGEIFPFKVIPNVVNTEMFNFKLKVEPKEPRFFMVSQWNYPKDPFSVIRSFQLFLKRYSNAKLIIGGYGKQENQIKEMILVKGLVHNVSFIGKLSSEDIANEMNKATAFIHLSTYETFSVVCAEAVCCGCPVIASNVGGIKEFINVKNGVLIDDKVELETAMLKMHETNYLREEIARSFASKFSESTVGKQYYDYLVEQI